MEQETKDGIAYLLALKQSSGVGGAAAPVPAKEPGLQAPPAVAAEAAGDEFKGAEKRRSPRYKCNGSAEIREEGCDVRTWATFSDISLHGCYVEAQATYPPGTVLHLKMEANGIRFEGQGTVRVTYPYLGMGIAFTDLSEENAIRLRELLGRILRPCLIMGPGIPSSLPATGGLGSVPQIRDAQAVVTAMIDFFENRQILMRDDFLRLLKKSQSASRPGVE